MEHCYRLLSLWCTMITITLGTLITGPEPMNVVAPLDSMVTFTCVVNTSETPAGRTLFGIDTDLLVTWLVNGTVLTGNTDQNVIVNGTLQIGTSQLKVTQDYLTGVPVQCLVGVRFSITNVTTFSSNKTTLTAYGPPEAPSNLTSTQSSDNALILSWSAPSSPVQLHYTVTANISTTIRMTNNTNITITREEVMTALNSSECDYYTFHVIASNPAGNSIPANLTTPVTFVPDPVNVQYSMCISMDNTTMIRFEPLDGYKYFIANESECLNATRSTTNGLTVFQIPYCTVLTVLAKHNCRERLIPISISNVTEQCPSSSTPTMIFSSFTSTSLTLVSTTSSATPLNNGSTGIPVWVIIAIVVVILFAIAVVAGITIIVLFVYVRQRKRKVSLVKPHGSVSTVDTEFKDEKTPQFKDDKSIALQNKQPMPEYMTPADALKQNGGDISTLKALQKQSPGLVSSSVSEYATPSVPHHNAQKVKDMPLYSDVFEIQKGTTWRSSQRKSLTHPNKSPAGSPLPPPPPSFGTTDEYSSLQHDLGGPNQPLVDQDQHVYDSALTDQPQYSSITQPKKTKYTDVQFSPDAGLTIQGNTNTVQYSVVGDTPNMEYSVVGPKTNISQDCPPPPPPPPSADVVRDMMNH